VEIKLQYHRFRPGLCPGPSVIFDLIYFLVLVSVSEIFFSFSFVFSHFFVLVLVFKIFFSFVLVLVLQYTFV